MYLRAKAAVKYTKLPLYFTEESLLLGLSFVSQLNIEKRLVLGMENKQEWFQSAKKENMSILPSTMLNPSIDIVLQNHAMQAA